MREIIQGEPEKSWREGNGRAFLQKRNTMKGKKGNLRNPEELNREFDLAIVGGGITGLSIAREAARSGYSTLLLEKGDFAGATSSATSKLIHGGLRYLENFEFDLVRESLRERRLLAGSATRLVKPLPIYLPLYRYSRPGRILMRMGLWIYDLLSFDRNRGTPRRNRMPMTKMLSRKDLIRDGFCLETGELKGGFLFYDYQSFHPERLALAFLKTATDHRAVVRNYTEVVDFDTEQEGEQLRIRSLHLKDLLDGSQYSVRARVIINATGPWMDLFLERLKGKPVHKLNRSQGIHILTRDICHGRNILHRNRKGRHFFILSWMGHSLIGPTDTPYRGSPDDLHPHREDVQRLLEDVNEALPVENRLKTEEIQQVLIGIRPLISTGEESGTYSVSRKAEIYDHARSGTPGLISVAGGKWTTSRSLGEEVLDCAIGTGLLENRPPEKIDTRFEPLHGSRRYGEDPELLQKELVGEWNTRYPQIPSKVLERIFLLYGTEGSDVLNRIQEDPALAETLESKEGPGEDEILAQVAHAVLSESAFTLQDILNRRLAAGMLGCPGQEALEKTAKLAGKLLGWNAKRIREEIQNYREAYPEFERLAD